MRMDWKSLGYEREYKDGRLRWVPKNPDIDKDTPSDIYYTKEDN